MDSTATVATSVCTTQLPWFPFSSAIEPDPRTTREVFARALRHQLAGRLAEADREYRLALHLQPDFADAHNNLGNLLAHRDSPDAAIVHYYRALASDPNHAEAHNNLGNILRHRGKFGDALFHYARAITLRPANAEAWYHRAEIKRFRADDEDLAVLETLLTMADLPPAKAVYIHFALAKAFDDLGDFTKASRHLHLGNRLKRRRISWDEPAIEGLFDRLSQAFDKSLMERMEGSGDPSPSPVFILGMPRSGSTLIEQILAGHPAVSSAGESSTLEQAATTVLLAAYPNLSFPDCVASLGNSEKGRKTLQRIGETYLASLPPLAAGKTRVVNKLPNNFLYVGLIHLILPNAKIIHTVRNPMDTCMSCYTKLFACGQNFSYDLAELGHFYRLYEALMRHWRSILPPAAILDIRYEDVVENLDREAHRLIEYCELPWDSRCLDFRKASPSVSTASAFQVRQPLFKNSVGRWRNYESSLGPLLGALEPARVRDFPARPAEETDIQHR